MVTNVKTKLLKTITALLHTDEQEEINKKNIAAK